MEENLFENALNKFEKQKCKQVVVNKSGINALGLLGVGLVLLKVTDNIDWSWVWVLAPFWIPLGIALLVVIGLLIAVVMVSAKGGNFTVSKDEDENAGQDALNQEQIKVPVVIGIIQSPDFTPEQETSKPKPKKKSKKNTTNGNIDTTNKEPENSEGTEAPNN